jgi:predicted ATP-grasp superfamily ATP-dependent carboligase
MMHAAITEGLATDVPVLLLGGMENTLAVTRSLGAAGIAVRVSGKRACVALTSRHCAEAIAVPEGADYTAFWSRLLLGEDRRFDGHLVLPLMDEAIDFVVAHRDALARRYLLEDFDPDLRGAMLDKKETLRIAARAGVPAPRFWNVASLDDLARAEPEVTFPVMVKPIHSHKFARVFGRKLFIVDGSLAELRARVAEALDQGIEIMVTEMIPGADSELSSYYTYIDDTGRSLFHYTKRVIRRFPVHRGGGCYHESRWLPETAEMGRRFFASIPWRGMANIEFKRDPRDGRLKVIEVNARFTAAHRLVQRAGLPIDLLIYRHLTGQSVPEVMQDDAVLRLWKPYRDFRAYRALARSDGMTLGDWLTSIREARNITPAFAADDPAPSVAQLGLFLRQVAKKVRR